MAAARVEAALGGGWVLYIPLPGGAEDTIVFTEHDQAEQAFALLALHTALQAGDAAEVQRLGDVVQVSCRAALPAAVRCGLSRVTACRLPAHIQPRPASSHTQADDESLAELRELSLPEFVQMVRLSLEEAAANGGGEPPPPASDNNATPSPNAHVGPMISMNSTAAGAQSPGADTVAPMLDAIKQEPEALVKTEEGQEGQPSLTAAAVAAALAVAKGLAEPMQLDEQHWDGMEVDDDAVGSDYPGVMRVLPGGGGSSSGALGWQVALLVRLDAAGSPDAAAEPTEQQFCTATELGEFCRQCTVLCKADCIFEGGQLRTSWCFDSLARSCVAVSACGLLACCRPALHPLHPNCAAGL